MTTKTMQVPPSKNLNLNKKINRTPVNLDSIEALTPETDKMVTGTFINVECSGQPAKISCRFHRWQEYFSQTLEDGKKYTIPLSVARHINENCKKEEHTNLTDEKGMPLKGNKFTSRYRFTPDY